MSSSSMSRPATATTKAGAAASTGWSTIFSKKPSPEDDAMPAESVGILMHKRVDGQRLVLLVHPGGPFWRGKDLGAWSIPKGEPEPGEAVEATARREFAEELGTAPEGPLLPLGRIRQR